MRAAFSVFWETARDAYDQVFALVLLNALAWLLCLPLVTAPPALAALWAMGNQVARGEAPTVKDYFGAFRQYFGWSWLLAGLNALALGLFAVNVWFYAPGNNPLDLPPKVAAAIRYAWVGLALAWLAYAQYLFPLVLEQADRRLRTTLRNAAVLLATQPLFSFTLLGLSVLVAAVSTALTVPWFVITPAFLGVLANNGVRRLLKPHRESQS